MGMEGKHDQIACSGRIAEKQVGQSGYGGVLRLRNKLEARSSPPGRLFAGRSPRGLLYTICFHFEDPGCVRLAPKFARRPPSFFGGAGAPSPLSPSGLVRSPYSLLEAVEFDLEESGWMRLAPKLARQPAFFGSADTPSGLSPSPLGGFRYFGLPSNLRRQFPVQLSFRLHWGVIGASMVAPVMKYSG